MLKKWRQITLLQLEITQKYPNVFNFLKAVYFEEADEVKQAIKQKHKHFTTSNYISNFLRETEDCSVSEISRQVDVHWRTAKRYADQSNWNESVGKRKSSSP